MPDAPPARPVTVVKVGGALVADADAGAALWAGVRALRRTDDVVVVHGGGPQSTALARRLGHEPRIVAGRRVTTDLDLDVAKWTLRGAASADLAAAANAHGVPAVGVAGVDGGLIRATRRPVCEVDGEPVDFGHVGDVVGVDARLLTVLMAAGFVPVVCSLAADGAGRVLNVNADTAACALAGALGARRFLLATESGGVRRIADEPASRLDRIDAATFASGVEAGWIAGGMRPKLEVAFAARATGVPGVYVLAPHDLMARREGTRVE